MSRPAKSSPVVKRDIRTGPGDAQDEVCPVCKSSRYLQPNLRFLINPECYHKICSSCVDRIFSHGPAQCPIPRCGKTLRKARFRTQTFEDLQVEREVDIRKKVAAVFNKREDEFENLRDWNDYLNEVEDITFNLINQIDLPETEARFEAYRAAHEAEISENASLAEQERAAFSANQKAEREAARSRRDAARREDAEEKREAETNRRDVLNRLATGNEDAEMVAREGQKVQLKKRMDRQAAAERQRQLHLQSQTNGSTNLIRGLKTKRKQEPEEPVDPFGGLKWKALYYSLQEDYVWTGVQETKNDTLVSAGGYDVKDFTSRALCEAFAGLGVFVGDDDTEVSKVEAGEEKPGTARAEVAAKDTKMKMETESDDVF